MALITKEEVLKIAHMSRIAIHEDEIDSLVNQLESVLSYAQCVTKISAIQEQVVQNKNIFRDDVVQITPAEPLLARGPQVQEHYFVVPAVLDAE